MTLSSEGQRQFQVWGLSRYYGYVRSPDAFARLGMTWALTGYPAMAAASLRRALDLAPDQSDHVTGLMASLYVTRGNEPEGEQMYREILTRDAGNVNALLGLAHLSMRKGKFDEASELIDKAQKAGLPAPDAELEKSLVSFMAGRLDEAQSGLAKLVESHPDMTRAWAVLANVALQKGDVKTLEECERTLSRTKGGRSSFSPCCAARCRSRERISRRRGAMPTRPCRYGPPACLRFNCCSILTCARPARI